MIESIQIRWKGARVSPGARKEENGYTIAA